MKKFIAATVFCLFLFFVAEIAANLYSNASQGRGKNVVEIVYDRKAISREYSDVFKSFSGELSRVLRENPGRILGRHRILVSELVNSKNPYDVRFFILLDISEPVVISWQRINRLKNDEALSVFIKEAAQKTFEILCGESDRDGSKPLKINSPTRVDL